MTPKELQLLQAAHYLNTHEWIIALVIVFAVWDIIWKLIALWRAGRNGQLAWFICLAIFNTVGILPIIYIYFFQEDKK